MRSNFLFSLILICLFSCSPKSEKELTILSKRLQNVKYQFEQVDKIKITQIHENYIYQSKMVKRCIDSVESKFNLYYSQYRTIKKVVPRFFEVYKISKENIKIQEQQLTNLKYDIKNQLIKNDTTSFFLKLESDNIDHIEKGVNELLKIYNYVNINNDSLYDYIYQTTEKYCDKNEI